MLDPGCWVLAWEPGGGTVRGRNLMLFQLAIISAGYILGVAILLLLKLFGVIFAFGNSLVLVLALPLISVCLAEALTLFWTKTPGSMGLGGLIVFLPMVIAGVINAVAAVLAQKWMSPFDLSNGVRNFENLTGWLVLSVLCCVITLSLWRFWPAPTARLW